MKKKKIKTVKQELMFPKQLNREDLFPCPIWYGDEPGFVNELNNASDPYIETSKKNLKESIDKRNKKFGYLEFRIPISIKEKDEKEKS